MLAERIDINCVFRHVCFGAKSGHWPVPDQASSVSWLIRYDIDKRCGFTIEKLDIRRHRTARSSGPRDRAGRVA